jgi:hypothetical protein
MDPDKSAPEGISGRAAKLPAPDTFGTDSFRLVDPVWQKLVCTSTKKQKKKIKFFMFFK